MESKPKSAIICVYCRFDDECDAVSILRCCIHQLLAQHPRLLPLVDKYYKKHRSQRTGLEMKEVVEMLRSLITALDSVHIVVDGLDEISSDKERATLLRNRKSSLRVF